MRSGTLPLFQTDYVISWDFSKSDAPCVRITRLDTDESGSCVLGEVLGVSYEKAGVVSLRQLLAQESLVKRAEAEIDADRIRRAFTREPEKEETDEP